MKRDTMMRVAMYYNNRDVRLEEMPVPAIGPGEALVKVIASGFAAATCSNGTGSRKPLSCWATRSPER